MTAPGPQSAHSQETSPDASRPPAASSAATSTADPATTTSGVAQDASGRQPAAAAASASELASTKIGLYEALRRFVDFPIKGIVFIDIMPIFRDPATHATLLHALELQALHFPAPAAATDAPWVDLVVGLDARGFLFGPGLALKLGAGFAPVRKQGKLPGPCVTASYAKEYGTDYFQMQEDAIKPGQKVLIVDDIIATGMFLFAVARCFLPFVRFVPKSHASTYFPANTRPPRRISGGGWRTRPEAWWPARRLPVYSRDLFPQGPGEAWRRACDHSPRRGGITEEATPTHYAMFAFLAFYFFVLPFFRPFCPFCNSQKTPELCALLPNDRRSSGPGLH